MPSFYDILIVIAIFLTVLPAVILLYHRAKSPNAWEYHHKKASLGLSLTLLLGTVLILYGTFVEPRLLVTNYQSVDIDNFVTEFSNDEFKDVINRNIPNKSSNRFGAKISEDGRRLRR